MNKRYYHDDGRAFTEEEYAAVAARQAKRKEFWVRAAKDFAVIWVIASIHFRLQGIIYDSDMGFRTFFTLMPFTLFIHISQALILTCVFTYCVRILRSGFWYFLISLTLTVWMFIYSVENAVTIRWIHNGIYYNIGGDYTLAGLKRKFFIASYYLLALFSFCLLLYNPFKSVSLRST